MEEIVIIEDLEPEEIVLLEEQVEYVAPSTQEKEITPTEQEQIVRPDEGIFALSKVKVNAIPSEYIIPSGSIDITENGNYDVKDKEYANVNIPEKILGTKTITENGNYKATDDGIDGYSEVNVNVSLDLNNTLVIENLRTDGYPESAIWYGEEIPNGALRYYNYSNTNNVILSRTKNITRIGTSGLQNSYANLSDDFLDEVLYAGEYALAISRTDTTTIRMPKWDGKDIDGKVKGSIFRISNNGIKTVNYILPKMQYVGDYNWYQNNRNITVQIGSIGYGVVQVNSRPFGGTTGVSSVTCYTTGAKLDSVSTAIINQAGANVHFTFKASENTTYGGTTYQAGETMLTI